VILKFEILDLNLNLINLHLNLSRQDILEHSYIVKPRYLNMENFEWLKLTTECSSPYLVIFYSYVMMSTHCGSKSSCVHILVSVWFLGIYKISKEYH
jgi:hypothetical protein